MLTKLWRLLFRLLYNECASAYDLVSYSVSLGQWRSWQRCVFHYLPSAEDGPVLEIAHGTGDLQIDLIQSGYRTVALDLSPRMGKLARRKLHRACLPANLMRGDAFQLPLASESCPAIICTFPTHFIFQAPVLAEMERVLRPSGRVVVVLVGQLDGGGILPWLIRGLYRLTGQRDAFLSQSTLYGLVGCEAFAVEPANVTLRGSAVQLLILTKVHGTEASTADVSLDTMKSS